MIEAHDFIEAARASGFRHYTGVPCSFLSPFINYVIDDDELRYISSANEGDALATAAGLAIGGQPAIVMMQNSGLGNAVSPLTSLTHVFLIPMIVIVTHRGASGLKDEPQHELMGQITEELFQLMRVPYEAFPTTQEQIAPTLQRAVQSMRATQRPYGLIMQKGAVAAHPVKKKTIPSHSGDTLHHRSVSRLGRDKRLRREQVLRHIVESTAVEATVLVSTTGFTSRELFAIADRVNHLYMVGSMGCVSSLGLGMALARPDLHIIILDGDGAALMRMGNLATIGCYGGANLSHILLDNEAHDSTGGQATVSATVRFADIAAACGYIETYEGDDLSVLEHVLCRDALGARFVHMKIAIGSMDGLPRPNIGPKEKLRQFMSYIGSTFND